MSSEGTVYMHRRLKKKMQSRPMIKYSKDSRIHQRISSEKEVRVAPIDLLSWKNT
jgi:hypothetical protein